MEKNKPSFWVILICYILCLFELFAKLPFVYFLQIRRSCAFIRSTHPSLNSMLPRWAHVSCYFFLSQCCSLITINIWILKGNLRFTSNRNIPNLINRPRISKVLDRDMNDLISTTKLWECSRSIGDE